MKRLYRFYCVDCDHAWMQVLSEYKVYSMCEYCSKEQAVESEYGVD